MFKLPAPEEMVFFDMEASSFDGFPIAIGVALEDGRKDSILIRPHGAWDHSKWSAQAEECHGISYERLMKEGRDCAEVVEWLEGLSVGRDVIYSDHVLDYSWLNQVYNAIGRRLNKRFECTQTLFYTDLDYALDAAYRRASEGDKVTHKPDEDAERACRIYCENYNQLKFEHDALQKYLLT